MATPIDDDTLQRYYDGDLSPLEEHSVNARIEADPAAQKRLAELARLTQMMRDSADELGRSVRSAALFAQIEAKLAKPEQVGFGSRLRVVASEWLEHRRATLAPIVTAALVAAITLVAVVGPNERELVELPASGEIGSAEAVHGSRVEHVDFGASTGTVFEIDNGGVSAAVVWITDDEEAQ
ncbi:MAG TPA: hypothetical protein VG963_24630 [Polyangiaceae bacterium]|nr:hypothetical protein [Polyangiaceae bacterium]